MREIYRTLPKAFLAFMGIAALGACSSSDDVPSEPTVNPGESVKTSFTLSVGLPKGNSSAAKPATRVADRIAQANGVTDFRGIDNITLIPFNATIDGNSTRFGNSNITLPNATDNTLTNITVTGNAKVYNDVSIPVGTNHFLFYGKAIDGTATSSVQKPAEPFTYGYLEAAGLAEGTTSNINFTPSSIYTGDITTDAKATALVGYLNAIALTSYTPTTATENTWATYAAASANATKPLAVLYNNFITLTAGSSATALGAVQELYASLQNLTTGEGGNNLNADEAALRDAIVANIKTKTTNTSYDANSTLSFSDDVTGFPANISLPDGAATLTFADGAFKENTSSINLANGVQVASLSSFAYPANLWYFDNTDIKTSESALSDQYVDGTAWNEILAKYNEDNASVNALTRSIALKNQIQYAVGRLQAKVTAASSTLKDADDANVTVGNQTFPVTAILIGGQRQVDWQFTPASTTSTQYTMYDKAQSESYASTTGSKTNNTLVLETPASEKENIVVELTNNSNMRFKGKDGYVPVGGKFYLVAQLDPGTATQPTGATTTLNQVFKQDYVTVANLTIRNLSNAYNVIPDLRTPVLSIGMSVDLTWQTGLTFNVDM